VLYEALAAGCPLVTTRGVDTWPELEEAGASITEQDAAQLADAIEPMTRNRTERDRLGAKGRDWVFENLDPERIVTAFERFYSQALVR